MVTWLVLGCGTLGHRLIDDLTAGTDEVRVLEPDASRVETLRNERVAAETGDVTDPTAVADLTTPDIVLVAGDDPSVNRRALETAASVHPDAYRIAYVGEATTGAQRRAIREAADRVIDPGEAVVEHVVGALTGGEGGQRVRRLRETIQSIEGTLGVFTHDNPDPDAIASAVTLAHLARSMGVPAEVCYYGDISHQENRALVNLLEFDLRGLERGDPLEFGGYALIDHSRPGVNDGLPMDVDVDIVIDHHPAREAVEARFVDLRDDAGSTSTLLVDYLRRLGVEPEEAIATGLLYGIRVDTREFSRGTTPEDFEAAAFLLPHADEELLERIESPSMSADTLDTIARAVRERRVEGSSLSTCVGRIGDRDTLSQAADRLLGMEGISTTVVCGYADGTIYLSARTRGTDLDMGGVLRDAFGELGSAGGHADMAGAQIPMGLFEEVESDSEASLSGVVEQLVTDRFFRALRERRAAEAEHSEE